METSKLGLSLSEWRKHIEAAEDYQGTNTQYCREHGLVPHQFVYYKGKFRNDRDTKSKFIKMIPSENSQTPPEESFLFSSKASVKFLPDPEWLARLLQTLVKLQ